jgi:hypothetical protein
MVHSHSGFQFISRNDECHTTNRAFKRKIRKAELKLYKLVEIPEVYMEVKHELGRIEMLVKFKQPIYTF